MKKKIKYKDVMSLYKQIRDIKQEEKQYEMYLRNVVYDDIWNVKRKFKSFWNRLWWVICPMELEYYLSKYESLIEDKIRKEKKVLELENKRKNVEEKINKLGFPVNGKTASAESMMKAIYSMRKVK